MTKLPKDAPVIATDKAKWDPNYQKKIGLMSGPAKLEEAMAHEIERTSKRIYRLLGLSGYARLDYRLTDRRRLYLLEANPNPQIARKEDFRRFRRARRHEIRGLAAETRHPGAQLRAPALVGSTPRRKGSA